MSSTSTTDSILRLSQIAYISAGVSMQRLNTQLRGSRQIRVIALKDVGRQLAPLKDLMVVLGSEGDVGRFTVAAGDVVVTPRGSEVRAAVVPRTHEGAIAGANLAVIKLRGAVLSPFLLATFLCERRTQARLLQETAGASTPGFTIKVLSELPIKIPSPEHQATLVRFLEAANIHRQALTQALALRERVCDEVIAATLAVQEER
jgi:hypothetical protein